MDLHWAWAPVSLSLLVAYALKQQQPNPVSSLCTLHAPCTLARVRWAVTFQRWGLLIPAEALSPMGRNDKSLLWSPRSLPFSITARSTLMSLLIVYPLPHSLESVK